VPNIHQLWASFESWLLDPPSQKLSPMLRQLRQILRILYAVIRDVVSGQISLHAMSLVYTTILSVVPMLALCFSVLKAFNVQDQFTPMLYSFLEPMGEKGIEIHDNVLAFVDNMKVGLLGAVGFVMLLYTVISLIQKIERAFNTIWLVPQLRSIGERFSNYLSVVMVGPVLLVAAISMTASTMNSTVVQSLVAIEPFGSLIYSITKLIPFLMIIAAFTFFYIMMPNTKVSLKSAVLGGVMSGSAWQACSMAFTAFVVNSSKYDAIYSGFAVGILLLIWLYMNWLILLLGSSIAFYHQHGSHITRFTDVKPSPEVIEQVGLDIVRRIAQHYESEQAPISQAQIENDNNIPAFINRQIIDKLITQGLVLLAGEKADQLVPGRSTDQITVADVLKVLRKDDAQLLKGLKTSPKTEQLMARLNSAMDQSLENVSLRDLIEQKQN
jgi:membrane protein